MRDRVVKRLDRLGREGAAVVEDRPRDHHRQPRAGLLEELVDGEQARLHDQRVERRLGQQDVDAAGDQGADLLVVAGDHLVEGRVAAAGVVDVDAHRELLLGRADAAGDEPGLVGVLAGEFVRRPPGQLGRGLVQLEDVFLEPELLERDRGAVEGVGLDDVGAGFEVGAMDVFDDLGLGEHQGLGAVLDAAAGAGRTAGPGHPLR